MKVLITKEQLDFRIKTLGQTITNDLFGQQDIIVAPILKGGMIFASHLIPYIEVPLQVEYFHTSRYHGEEAKELKFHYKPNIDYNGKTIILIDDIFDEGITLNEIEDYCLAQGAKKVLKVVLLDKEKCDIRPPKYVGFKIPNYFVYGFGLDVDGFQRNCQFIAYNE